MKLLRAFLTLLLVMVVAPGGCGDGKKHRIADIQSPDPISEFTVRIVEPNGTAGVIAATPVTLRAQFLLENHPITVDSVSWASNLVGVIGSTNPLTTVSLPIGLHSLTVTGTLGERSVSSTVGLRVGDFAVQIEQPADGSRFSQGAAVHLRGTARVLEGTTTTTLLSGPAGATSRTATYQWASDRDGVLGSTSVVDTAALSVGTHIIELTVHDNLLGGTNKRGTAQIQLVVTPPNVAPTVQIVEPVACNVDLELGQTLQMTGTVTDPDSADLGLVPYWLDSITGERHVGTTFDFGATAALGQHEVQLVAEDALGAKGEARCVIFVVPVGGSRTDLFPSVNAINGALIGNDQHVRWIDADAFGQLLFGNLRGLSVFSQDLIFVSEMNGANLGFGPGDVSVHSFLSLGADAFIAANNGLTRCSYDGITTSNCELLSTSDFSAIDGAGNPASSAWFAGGNQDGIFLANYYQGVLAGDVILKADNSNLPEDQVDDVVFVADRLYVATAAGVCVVTDITNVVEDPASNVLCSTIIDESTSILPNNDVEVLFRTNDFLWIGTESGLVRLTLATDNMFLIGGDMAGRDVRRVASDSQGILWIISFGEVVRLNSESETAMVVPPENWGFPLGTDAQWIYVDASDRKWIGTNVGVGLYVGN